jgi:hypothetical protein
MKVAYTNLIKEEFGLDSDEKMSKVQFFTSATIILNQELKADNQVTTQNGTLVSSSNSEKESIIIPAGTRCLFDHYGPKGEIFVRFENGDGRVLRFFSKSDASKRFYFDVDWAQQGGPKINYGDNVYKVDLLRGSPRSAVLNVARKKLERSKRKERVVRGLKI